MNDDTFKKRPGTTDHGKPYEDLNVSNLVLKLVRDKTIDEFKIASNHDKYDSFDDIIVETTSAGKTVSSALQLKHSDGGKTLSINSLKEGSNFIVSKYFEAYKKINSDTHRFILFTNRKFNYPDGTEIYFDQQDFSVRLMKRDVDPLICNSRLGVCYQFTHLRSAGASLSQQQRDYQKFFEKFFLYTNQANVVQLEKSVSMEFQKTFSCSDDAFQQYHKFITDWSDDTGNKNMLVKDQMKKVIAFCVLSKLIKPLSFGELNKRMIILRNAMLKFQVTVVKRQCYEQVKQLWGDKRKELDDKLQEVNKVKSRYRLKLKYVKSADEIDDNNCSKLLWIMGISPLIVLYDRSTYEIIQLCTSEKFVVLGQINEDELQDCSVFQNLSDLFSMSEDYINVTKKLKYSVQGKTKQSLQCLLHQDEEVAQNISTDDLLGLLEGPVVTGGGQEVIPTPYMDRNLIRNIINYKYLNEIDKNTVIVIDCISRNDTFKNRVRNFNLVDINDHLTRKNINVKSKDSNFVPDFFVKETECSAKDFQRIYEKNVNANKGHHFSLTADGQLEWVHSESTTEELKPFLAENGSTCETALWSMKSTFNLIIGEPGMGKSVMMKNLKNNSSSAVWTLLFDTEDIKKMLKSDAIDVSNFILTEKYPSLTSFEKKLLKILIKKNQVVYVWDALDEINTEDLQRITDLILEICRKKIRQWVTCRYYLKNSLERKFNVFAKKIIQFTEEQQSQYIQKRLHHQDSDVTLKIKNLIVNNEILGIPLQIYMLTELFREDPKHYSQLSSDIFNVTKLYLYFVSEKFKIYFKRQNVDSEHVRDHVKNTRRDQYRMASLRAIVPFLLKETDKCNEFLEEIRNKTDPVGIITEVTNDNIPHFIHKSFAEYFVAVYFVQTKNKELRNIIFDNTLKNVRFFFDLLMAEESPAHVAVMYKSVETLYKLRDTLANSKDLGMRNLLHLACSWGQEYPEFKVYFNGDAYIMDTSTEKNFSVTEEDPRYVEMLHLLLDKCHVAEKDELFLYSALTYAEKTSSLFAKTIILQQGKEKFTFEKDWSMASILYYAAKFGYLEVFNLYLDLPLIRTIYKETYLHLCVSQEKILQIVLDIDVYLNNIDKQDVTGHTALSRACQNGEANVVNRLLSCNANINIPSQDGRTPLHHACQSGHYKIARRLIQYGSKVNVKDDKNCTPLHLACLNGHKDVVELLAKKNADVNQANSQGWTPLHSACINGHYQIIELLKNANVDINISKVINIPNDIDWTPLHSACWYGHTQVVEILVRFGVELNRATKDGQTPLHYACEKGYERIVEILCANGAQTDILCAKSWMPLHVACHNGHSNAVQILLNFGRIENSEEENNVQNPAVNAPGNNGDTPLHVAASKGHTRIVHLLLDNGAAINTPNDSRRTPLHSASQQGHNKTVDVLISRGSDVNARDNKDLTPLHLSCMKNHYSVVKLLTENDADVNAISKNKSTPLHLACQCGHDQTVQLLLNKDADVNAADGKNVTPLHVACFNGYDKIVEKLMKNLKNVNVATSDGYTPVHYASLRGHVKTLKKLILCDADLNLRTEDLKTPLYSACCNGHTEVVKLLLERSVDINAATNTGSTPLHAACENNYFQAAWLLITSNAKRNSVDQLGFTPLHVACNEGHSEIVRLLISSEGNVNATTRQGLTLLHLTCLNKDVKMCQYVLDCADRFYVDIDVNIGDLQDRTPLFLACQYQQTDIFNVLLKRGAKIHPKDNWTPLHYASFLGQEQMVEFLLQQYHVELPDFNERSPLYYACRGGHYSIVNLLIKHQVNVNTKDFEGRTPLHVASEENHPRVVQLLIENNVEVNAKDKDERTPLHEACEGGHIRVVKLLVKAGGNVKARTSVGATPLYLANRKKQYEVVDFMTDYFKKETCCVMPWRRKK